MLLVCDQHLSKPDRHVRRVHQNESGYYRGDTKAVFGDSLQPVREVFATTEALDTGGFREQRVVDVLHQKSERIE